MSTENRSGGPRAGADDERYDFFTAGSGADFGTPFFEASVFGWSFVGVAFSAGAVVLLVGMGQRLTWPSP